MDAANAIIDRADDGGNTADAYATLCIHAGIAAADVICCARLGRHARGDDHSDAVGLLDKADAASSKQLRTLLSMKTKAAYTHTPMSATDAKRAGRAADALVETARRLNASLSRSAS
jgi:hypothetical protein